jgi:hypothetical protein
MGGGFRGNWTALVQERATEASRAYYVGVDLGQAKDYTAISIVQRLPVAPVALGLAPVEAPPPARPTYALRYLERVPLGTPYPAIVRDVLRLRATAPLSGESPLIVDRTGVGRAVADMFTEAGAGGVHAISIHGGDAVSRETDHDRVPKRDLVGTLIRVHQGERLHTAAGLPLFPTLVQELVNFQLKVTPAGHDTYEAWRESVHDDLVLAVALAIWYAENEPAPIEELDEDLADAIRNAGRYW